MNSDCAYYSANCAIRLNQTGADNGIYVAASGAWSRAADYDAASELVAGTVFVSEGTTNGNSQWTMTTDAPITLGTTALVWTQAGGGASYTPGYDILISGGVITTNPAVVAHKASATIGDGSATTITITHNLNTQDVSVSVKEVATNAGVLVDWVANGVNTVQLTFGTAPSAGQYRATVIA